MGFQVAFALVVTAFACLFAPSTGQYIEGKCLRAIPLAPWKTSYRTSCRYLCFGWPIRYDTEPDGIHCGVFAPLFRTHVCRDGKCVEAEFAQTTSSAGEEYFRTKPSTSNRGAL
ncbi:hypothetical protein MRX96_035419 [Rhipicephalus microplus]